MLDFRKVLLALSVASFALVGTASAQVASLSGATITGGAAEGYVATEGMTEIIPSITMTVNNPGSITGALILTVSSNAPFNNQLVPHTATGQIDATAVDNATNGGAGGATHDTAASITQTGAATISITFNAIANTATTITISGLRSNASALPAGSQITLTVTSPSILIAAGQYPLNVAYTAASISSVTINAQPNINTCTVTSATNPSVANVGIINGFPQSLKSAADYTAAGNVAPTQGTVLAVTFNNLNPGVNYYVPQSIGTAPFVMQAYLSSTITVANAAPLVVAPNPAATTPIGDAAGQVALPASGTIYYAVTTSNNGTEAVNSLNGSAGQLLLTAVLPAAGVTTFGTVAPSVTVVVVSPTTAIDPATGYPEYSASATPITAVQAGFAPTGLVLPCQTTMLFPYVVNVAGFDTGISITNAQTGKGATSGSCNVTFYGTGNPATNPYVTGLIPPATSASSNTNLPLGLLDVGTVAPGFEGYAIATCNFQAAHGYAFVSNGTFDSGGFSNYLAVVLSDSGLETTLTLTAQ